MKISYFRLCLRLILTLAITLGSISCNKLTAQEIVTNVLNAYSKVRIYSVEDRMNAKTEVVGGDRPGTRLTSHNGTGIINIENREFEMDIMQDGQPIQGMQTSTKMYLVNEWLYIKGDILDYEDKDHEIWVKLDLDDEQLNHHDRLWGDNNPLEQQIELLNTAIEITMVGNENISGMDTYILNIKPDWQVLTDWLSLQPPWRAPRFFKLSELARSLSFRLWVCKETYLILKSEIDMDYEMVSFGSSKSTVEFEGEVLFSDYNKPFEIKIPKEALKAVVGPIA